MTIDPTAQSVNSRSYNGSRRRERAERNRDAILLAARSRFLDAGFAATTIASIAADAAISPDTIYKSFGGKPGLVRALCERALEGTGPGPAQRRSDAMQAAEQDPTRLLRGLGTLTTEVAPQIAPLLLLLAAAAQSDDAMGRLRAELDDGRLSRMTDVARTLAAKTSLRAGLTVKQAGEIMWAYSSPELYGLLVSTRGWTPARYGDFVGESLIAALLPEPKRTARRTHDRRRR
jgi:AcrR family transcriptional regulator